MPVLLIVKENGEERSFKLTSQPLVLGRSSKCHIQIQDQMCSGKHCAFKLNQQFKVLVKDLESTNGTYLNDCQIMDSHLMLDDIIKIGNCEIYIERSELSPRERAILTRDEPTAQIKFMDLPSNNKALKPSQVVRAKQAGQTPRTSQAPKKLFPEKPREAVPAPKENTKTPEEKVQKSGTASVSLKERIAAKGKKFKDAQPATQIEPSNERQIDLEESSGDTQFIKIDKPSTTKGKKEKTSFASKLKKVFKK